MKQRSKAVKQEYDFEARMAEITAQQKEEKAKRRAKRREAKQEKTAAMTDAEAMSMMGFGSFGSSKK